MYQSVFYKKGGCITLLVYIVDKGFYASVERCHGFYNLKDFYCS